MHKITDNMAFIEVLPALSRAAGPYVEVIDTEGKTRKLAVGVSVGNVNTGGTLAVVLTECDTYGGDYTALDSFTTITAAGYASKDIVPTKRFVKVTATVAVDDVEAAILAISYNERYTPSGVELV